MINLFWNCWLARPLVMDSIATKRFNYRKQIVSRKSFGHILVSCARIARNSRHAGIPSP